MINTPITEYLTRNGIAFRVLMQSREAVSIEDAALLRGIKPNMMVKTMVLRDMGNQYASRVARVIAKLTQRKYEHNSSPDA